MVSTATEKPQDRGLSLGKGVVETSRRGIIQMIPGLVDGVGTMRKRTGKSNC